MFFVVFDFFGTHSVKKRHFEDFNLIIVFVVINRLRHFWKINAKYRVKFSVLDVFVMNQTNFCFGAHSVKKRSFTELN